MNTSNANPAKIPLTIIRILIGWHFLYEGLYKLSLESWSSANYLLDSQWLLSGFFHWIVNNNPILNLVDTLNVWGLIFIGAALFLGVAVRLAGSLGAVLLLLYYTANPPFTASGYSVHHFYFINLNIIEAAVLAGYVYLGHRYQYGIGTLWNRYMEKRKEKTFPSRDNHQYLESAANSRRELIKNLAVAPLLGGTFFGMAKQLGWMSHEEENLTRNTDATSGATVTFSYGKQVSELEGKVPKGRLKGFDISRIIVGGNLISGFAHSRDLIYVSSFLKNYHTDEKVIQTLFLCEACGINTAILRTDENTVRILDKYRKRGGKIQWLAQTYPKPGNLDNVKIAIDHGAFGTFVQGNIADRFVKENQLENLQQSIDFMKSQGVVAGTAGHSINVPMVCEKEKLDPDFYMKTFHHDQYWSAHPRENRDEWTVMQRSSDSHGEYHDNIWCVYPEETARFMKTVSKPWIAYKVLAAGAIKPGEAFQYIFEQGADFACVGMFDFQVVENSNIAHRLLKNGLNRERDWMA